MFDCILPTAWAQHGKAFTSRGKLDLRRGVHRLAEQRLDDACTCEACTRYSRSYLHHLIKCDEPLGWHLLATHNLTFYLQLMRDIRAHVRADTFAAFKELVTRFPQSRYAPDATLRMRYLVNALASHEVHVARYYMKRGAYLAAANRAQYAIKHYAQAPAIEEAVFVLVLAYDRLGMNDLRDAADRVMRANFPDSRYLKPGGLRKDVPWWRLWDPDW